MGEVAVSQYIRKNGKPPQCLILATAWKMKLLSSKQQMERRGAENLAEEPEEIPF